MTQIEHDLTAVLDELKTLRDILALKMHLAKSELKDDWQELEEKWGDINVRSDQLKRELSDTAVDINEDLKFLARDLREGYTRLKNLLH